MSDALLQTIDTSTSVGQREYALLLMMSVHGCGTGEAIRLAMDDPDWSAATLKLMRPKTGVAFTLPLLPPVAKPWPVTSAMGDHATRAPGMFFCERRCRSNH